MTETVIDVLVYKVRKVTETFTDADGEKDRRTRWTYSFKTPSGGITIHVVSDVERPWVEDDTISFVISQRTLQGTLAVDTVKRGRGGKTT